MRTVIATAAEIQNLRLAGLDLSDVNLIVVPKGLTPRERAEFVKAVQTPTIKSKPRARPSDSSLTPPGGVQPPLVPRPTNPQDVRQPWVNPFWYSAGLAQ